MPEEGDNLQELRYCYLEGTGWQETMQWHGVTMPEETLWEEPIQILNLILECFRLSLLGGKVTELTTNVIAESMYAQCDADGNEYLLLDVLVDYNKDTKAIPLTDQHPSIWGRPVMCKTTAGWQICCQWKDGSTSWDKLSKLKESHPVQTAEFAVVQGIDHEPAFNWWVMHVLKKRDRMIASVRNQWTRYLEKIYGIELLKTVEQVYAMDAKNGNTLWADAISEEMENVRVAFEILPDWRSLLIGHQLVQCHMVFDMKILVPSFKNI